MEKNDLGPTDLREDLFDHFCEKLNSFCDKYDDEEKQLLSAITKAVGGEVPKFVRQVS